MNCPDISDNDDNYHYCDIGDNDDDNLHYSDTRKRRAILGPTSRWRPLGPSRPHGWAILGNGFGQWRVIVGNGDGQWASYAHAFTLDECACVLDAVTNVIIKPSR